MSTFAFTFARGGSKGLPGKNVKPLAGRPLLAWAIEASDAAAGVDHHFVSTDDAAIAAVARDCGATVIERPAELATDTSPEWLSWQHAVDWAEERYGAFETFVSVPATTPLRVGADIDAALARFARGDADVCLAVTRSTKNPAFDMVARDASDAIALLAPPAGLVARRQDAPPVYDIAGSVYVMAPAFIRTHRRVFDGRVVGVEVPRDRAVDIDEELDFLLAEVILTRRAAPALPA